MPTYSFECKHCLGVKEKDISLYKVDDFDKHIKKESPRCECSGRKVRMVKLIDIPGSILIKELRVGDLLEKESTVRPQEWFGQQSKRDPK